MIERCIRPCCIRPCCIRPRCCIHPRCIRVLAPRCIRHRCIRRLAARVRSLHTSARIRTRHICLCTPHTPHQPHACIRAPASARTAHTHPHPPACTRIRSHARRIRPQHAFSPHLPACQHPGPHAHSLHLPACPHARTHRCPSILQAVVTPPQQAALVAAAGAALAAETRAAAARHRSLIQPLGFRGAGGAGAGATRRSRGASPECGPFTLVHNFFTFHAGGCLGWLGTLGTTRISSSN